MSHDRLTRRLQSDWSGQTRLELACRTLFSGQRGSLIIDDPVLPTPFAAAIEGLAWVFSSQERKAVYGLSLVLLVWTDGPLRIPLGRRLWRVQVWVGVGVAQLRPPSLALPPRLCAL